MMFSRFIRFLLFLIVCLALVHAYPPSMSRAKWLPGRAVRHYVLADEQTSNYHNLADGKDNDVNDSNGLATWLFRFRKFCCAPPL